MPEELYTLQIESDPNNLLTVEEFVNYFAVDLHVPEYKLQNLLLAVTEGVTNAIIHGNKCDINKTVSISAGKIENRLVIKIKDQGMGFNPDIVPDPTSPENLLKDSGRGIYLMRIYMDNVEYHHTSEGNETILSLNL